MTLEKLPQNAAPSGALRITLSLATFKEEQHEAIPAAPFSSAFVVIRFAIDIDEGHARYVGGTEQGVPAGVVGHRDSTSATSPFFEQSGNKVEIPYAFIESYEYSKDVTRHLGVLPAIAVGLVKMRRHATTSASPTAPKPEGLRRSSSSKYRRACPALSEPSCGLALLRPLSTARMLLKNPSRRPPWTTTRPFPPKLLKLCDLLRRKEP